MKHISVFLWQGLHPSIRVRLNNHKQEFFPGLQEPTNNTGSITITGRSQGQKDTDRRDAIKRGGV